jgi:hypothetical protein
MSFRNQAQVYDMNNYRRRKEAVYKNAISFLHRQTPEVARALRTTATALMKNYGLSALNFPKFRITVDRGDIYISSPRRRRNAFYGT